MGLLASGRRETSQTAPKVLCTFGVVLVCLHTFVVVRTSPMGRATPTTLLASLKRNLTILSRVLNLTQDIADYNAKYTAKSLHLEHGKAAVSSKAKLNPALVHVLPTNVRKGKLYSRYGFFLQMSADGFVNGTVNQFSSNALFQFQSVDVGVLRIKNVASGRYLAMDKHGRLRGRHRVSLETLFTETQRKTGYHCYTSYKYKNWFIGMRKNGSRKPGRHTGPKQKAVQFILMLTK